MTALEWWASGLAILTYETWRAMRHGKGHR